jgi:hypothetical protein
LNLGVVGFHDLQFCKRLQTFGRNLSLSFSWWNIKDLNGDIYSLLAFFTINMGSVVLVARVGETRDTYRILVGKPGWKMSLGKTRNKLKDNIKVNLK